MEHEDALFSQVYDQVKTWAAAERAVNPQNILNFSLKVMALTQELAELRQDGPRKKRLVLAILRKIVEEEVPEDSQQALLILLEPDGLVGTGIDMAVSAARGALVKLPQGGGCCVVS